MRFRTVLVLLSLALVLLPVSAAAQTDAPPPPAEAAAPEAPAATFTVNTTSDSPSGTCGDGTCTLREALIEANANGSSKDTINFNVAGDGPHIINLASALQAVSQPVIINGASEPGATCGSLPLTMKIVLNGSGLSSGETGLKITASNAEVRGLVIQRFPSHGVEINGNSNKLACNYIGTNSAGSLDLGNGSIGVYINNGGANELENNLISGNDSYGVYIGGANANGNKLSANRIGLTAAGSAALPNGGEGVLVQDATNTAVGVAGNGNAISGNSGHGILISGNSPGTVVEGNRIGTSSNGQADLGNGGAGVYINSTGARVGGSSTGSRNVISGNGQSGIVIDKGGAQIRRNIIGLNADANAKIPNNSYGIYVRNSNIVIGGAGLGSIIAGNGQDGIFVESGENNSIQGNFIGTNESLASGLGNSMFGAHVLFGQNTSVGASVANTIAHNGADGVYVPNDASLGTRISTNAIFANGDLGIDLGNSGVTPNDAGDPDTGPNGLQNFPTLTSAGSDGVQTRVAGTLNSKPNQTYRVEFFRTGGCDPSGYGEGRNYLGFANVTTNGSGNAAINALLSVAVSVGGSVSATATDAGGNTSEFSQCRSVVFENLPKPVYLPATMNQ
jgi:CSLREA domain-containing protein